MSTCSRRSHGLLRLLWGTHDSNQTLPWPTREMARLYAHKANRCNFSVTHVALRRPAVGDTWCTLHMGQLAPLSQSFALVTGHTRSTSTPCKPNTQDGAIVRMEVSSADGGGQGPGGPWWGNVAVIGDSRCTLTYRPTGRPRGLLRLLWCKYDPQQPLASPTREAARFFAWKLHSGCGGGRGVLR